MCSGPWLSLPGLGAAKATVPATGHMKGPRSQAASLGGADRDCFGTFVNHRFGGSLGLFVGFTFGADVAQLAVAGFYSQDHFHPDILGRCSASVRSNAASSVDAQARSRRSTGRALLRTGQGVIIQSAKDDGLEFYIPPRNAQP